MARKCGSEKILVSDWLISKTSCFSLVYTGSSLFYFCMYISVEKICRVKMCFLTQMFNPFFVVIVTNLDAMSLGANSIDKIGEVQLFDEIGM